MKSIYKVDSGFKVPRYVSGYTFMKFYVGPLFLFSVPYPNNTFHIRTYIDYLQYGSVYLSVDPVSIN